MDVRFGVRKVAITGGIASGKSMVQQYLKNDLAVPVIDADDITHDLYANDVDLKNKIRGEFGSGVFNPDGTVNRRALGNIVFNDKARMDKLSSWIHPKVRQATEDFFARHAHEKVAVAAVPVLFEYGLEKHYDEVWVVYATRDEQIRRLMARNNLTRQEAEDRVNSQMALDDKKKRADFVIDNSGAPDAAKAQVRQKVLDIRA